MGTDGSGIIKVSSRSWIWKMEYTTYMIFTSICFIVQTSHKASSDDCILDRNKHNTYPFVLKIVQLDGELVGHASLVTPIRVLSASEPFGRKTRNLVNFTAEIYDERDLPRCSISRKPILDSMPDQCAPGHPKTACWELETPFPVTLNHPFLYSRMDDMLRDEIETHLEETMGKEKCELLVYNDKDDKNLKTALHIVTFISKDSSQHSRYRDLFCRGEASCIEHYFYASEKNPHLFHSRHYEGAVLLCRAKPTGMLIRVDSDPQKPLIKVMQFKPMVFVSVNFIEWAQKEWPQLPTTTTTSTYRPSTTGRVSTRTPVTRTTSTSTTLPTTISTTDASSRIPNPPTMTPSTTTKATTHFIRTKPSRVKPVTKRSYGERMKENPSMLIFNCTIFLVIEYMLL